METSERIKDILDKLEEAISYEDFTIVEDARKELIFLLEDLESDFPNVSYEDDY